MAQNAMSDLEETITLTQVALELAPPPDFDRSSLLEKHTLYLQQRIEKLGITADSAEAAALQRATLDGPSQVNQVVWHLVLEAIATVPPRLIDTCTGILCDRTTQISQFEPSSAYHELLAVITGRDSA